MKNMNKLFQVVSCLLLLGAGSAGAVSLEDLQAAEANREYVLLKSSGPAVAHAATLWYVGTATEAVVTITSTAIQSFAPAGTGDTSFGTANSAYDLSAAGYDTFGELCDAIDALANYECLAAGAIRSDNTNTLRDQTAASGTNDLKANRGFEVHFDTGPINGGGNGNRLFDLRVGRKPAPGKRLVLRQCTGVADSVNDGDLRVYGKPKWAEVNPNPNNWTWDDTYEVYRDTFTNAAAAKTWTFAPSGIGGISFAKDAHAVVSMGNGTTLQVGTDDSVPSYLECWFEEQ